MKIWFDLRTINTNSYYFKFIYEILSNIWEYDKENTYIIYTSNLNYYNFIELSWKIDVKKIDIIAWSFEDQFAWLKFFNEEKLDTLIFFSYLRPYFYKKRNFIIIENVIELLYPKYKSSFKKFYEILIQKLSYNNSEKIIWFSKDIPQALNEKLNIKESKVEILNPFFIKSRKNDDFVDIRMKYNIINDYIIYPGKNWQNKNLARLIEAIARINNEDNINLELLFLDKEIWDSIDLRWIVLKNNMQNKIKFLSDIKDEDLYFYYYESIWVVYPSMYESFPFELSNSINFNANIIASRIKNIKDIFWDSIEYFSAMSVWEMKDAILKLKKQKKDNEKYIFLEKDYSIDKSINNLINLIKI